MNNSFLTVFVPLVLSSIAIAQQEMSGVPSYKPPEGEKPVYGKVFRPDETPARFVVELNPLRLIRKGISLEAETRIQDDVTVGVDVLFSPEAQIFDKSDETGDVTAKITYLGVEPKMRFYPAQSLSGVFFTAKLAIGISSYEIVAPSLKDARDEQVVVAPVVQIGYRFTNFTGLTLSGYIGGGLNMPKLQVKDPDKFTTKLQREAKSRVNDERGQFRPDFGVTLGIAF